MNDKRIVGENSEIHPPERPAQHSTTVSAVGSAAGVSPDHPSPLPMANVGLPAQLQNLTERARSYVEAASSANTRKAYASDWKHFSGVE